MDIQRTLDDAKKLFSSGNLDDSIALLSDRLLALEQSPFHKVLDLQFNPRFLDEVKKFYQRQKKKGVGLVLHSLRDITRTKRWTHQFFAFGEDYQPPYRQSVLSPPISSTQEWLFGYMGPAVDRGFSTAYLKGKFPDAGELARLLVSVKRLQAMNGVAAQTLKNVKASVAFADVGADVYAEYREGQWVKQNPHDQYSSFDAGMGEFDKRIKKRLGKNAKARFAAYELFPCRVLVDNLESVAFSGQGLVTSDADPDWGGEKSEPFESELLTEPTWLDLCEVLEHQMKKTRDLHHVFLEGIEKVGEI